ncbi:DUF6383 domain-containing protein [Parabacteroides sp.]
MNKKITSKMVVLGSALAVAGLSYPLLKADVTDVNTGFKTGVDYVIATTTGDGGVVLTVGNAAGTVKAGTIAAGALLPVQRWDVSVNETAGTFTLSNGGHFLKVTTDGVSFVESADEATALKLAGTGEIQYSNGSNDLITDGQDFKLGTAEGNWKNLYGYMTNSNKTATEFGLNAKPAIAEAVAIKDVAADDMAISFLSYKPMAVVLVSSDTPATNSATVFTGETSGSGVVLKNGSDYLAVRAIAGKGLQLVAVASSADATLVEVDTENENKVCFVDGDTKYYLKAGEESGFEIVGVTEATVLAYVSTTLGSAAESIVNSSGYYLVAGPATTNDTKCVKLGEATTATDLHTITSAEMTTVDNALKFTGASDNQLKINSAALGTSSTTLEDNMEVTVGGDQALAVTVKDGVLVTKDLEYYVVSDMQGKLALKKDPNDCDCGYEYLIVAKINSSAITPAALFTEDITENIGYVLVRAGGRSFSLTGTTNLEYVPSEAKVPTIANYADFKDAKKWNIEQYGDSVLLKTTEGYLQYKVSEDGTVSMSVADKATSKFFLGAETITSKYGEKDQYALKLNGGVSLVKDDAEAKVNIYADITPNTDGSGTNYDEDGTVIGVPATNAVLYFNIGKQYLVVGENGAVVLVDEVAEGQEKNASWVFEKTGEEGANTGYYKSVATGKYLTVADDAIAETKAAETSTIFTLSDSKETIIEVSTADNSVTVVNDAGTQTPTKLGFDNDGKLTTVEKEPTATPVIATLQKSNEVVVPAVKVGTYVDGDNYVAGEYYLLSIGGDKAVRYDAENKKCILVASADNASALDLWKMVETKVGDKYTYSFVSKSDDKVFFTVGGENTFIGGVKSYKDAGAIQLRTDGGKYVTVNAQGELALEETTDKAVVLCQAGVMPYSAATLNALEGAGFSLTVDVKKDAKATIKGADMFAGKLTAVETNGGINTSYQLKTADGKFIVLLQKGADNAAWGTGSDMNGEGTYSRGYKFSTVKEIKAEGKYLSNFRISHAAGSDSKDLIVEVMDAANTAAFGRLYIAKVDGEYLLTTTNSKAPADVYPYVVAGNGNGVKIKGLVEGGRFVNISYVNSKKVTGGDGNLDRFGKAYTVGLNAKGEMVVGYAELNTEILASAPEAQWAITGTDAAITFTNREQPTVNTGALTLYATATPDVYSVESKVYNVTDANGNNVIFRDTIRLSYVKDITKYDGFMFAKENQLRNQRYNLSAINQVGNVTQKMYWAENQGTHKIGLDGDVENAGKWKLSLDKKADKDGNIDALIDTAFVISTVSIIKDDKVVTAADTLAILPYLFQNADNDEYVKYNDNSLEAGEFYICDKNKNKNAATRFALKMRPDSTYHFVTLNMDNTNSDNQTTPYRNPFVNKLYAGSSTNLLNHVVNYSVKGNDLMSVTPIDVPEYRQVAFGDTIRIYREENPSQVVYEKHDASVLVEGKAPAFLNIDNVNQFKDINPAIFVDTAYVNRESGENTCYQYLLAVNVEEKADAVCPLNPEHNSQAWRDEHNNGKPCPDAVKSNYVRGRFLINLMDTANVYESKQLHSKNPYIDKNEAGEYLAKLAFVDGYHLNDTLFIQRGNGEYVKLDMSTPDFNIAKFAFHYVDYPAGTFKIQTLRKNWKSGDLDRDDVNYQDGYLKWINGTVVVANGFAQGDVFDMDEDETRIPTANEGINGTSTFSVAAIDGAVVVKGAEGKEVVISNLLGQPVASTVITSSEATISVPTGVVIVAVEGEAAVKAIVK